MKYCKICLQPDTRPNTYFNSMGICPACSFSQEVSDDSWKKPKYSLNIESFKEYIQPHLKNVSGYDCCLGVSGGKDSTKQALFARDVLNLNPKLVSLIFPPELITVTGTKNISNLIELGFQVEMLSPAPQDWKRLMLLALKKFGNPLVPTELALYSSVPRVAIQMGLKLILWGENPALQLGDMNTLASHPYDGDNISQTNTLKNAELGWFDELNPPVSVIDSYHYPPLSTYQKYQLKTVFMGPIIEDWSLVNNGKYAALHGIDVRNEHPLRIGDIYGVTALDQHITPFNQVLKYLKYGFGRMTDYANEEIRLGRLSRQDAIPLVKQYDGKCSLGYFKRFAKYLDISYEEFWDIIDQFVDKNLFTRISIDEYVPMFEIGEGVIG
ncbi:N-acetyl sugar amidotransferase [Synechococcus sp. AH-601-N10]|nr:N-acetyl sugar amidotransferase [Synechococcus sp. AH-601-N10]